jgi:hypothetical protein
MRRFIIGLLFGLLAGSLVGYWWLRRIGKIDDPASFVGQIVKTAREAAAEAAARCIMHTPVPAGDVLAQWARYGHVCRL